MQNKQSRPEKTRLLKLNPTTETFQVISPFLVLEEPGQESRRFDITTETVLIGAHPECDVVVEDEYVSGQHCRVSQTESGFLLEDLGSTNGTFIDGIRVGRTNLKRKTDWLIGKTKIRFDDEDREEPVVPLDETQFCGMIGSAEAMRRLFSKIRRVGPTDQTVLIQGETGTGKELVARALHELSNRKGKPPCGKPYVILNCGAISSNLIESELFGHEKGAFTGAMNRRIGAFESASGGTLFLDEVGELPLELQPKLLRVLENRTIRRVGGDTEIPVDVRVIAATHRNLADQVKRGDFREDLFFRLYVIPLLVPPLRERMADIPFLAEYFLRQTANDSSVTFNGEALHKLAGYSWPGNIRELKNVILRALVFCDGSVVEAKNIEWMGDQNGERMTLERLEKEKISEALKRTDGNRAHAADLLGIAKSTLFKKIKDYGIAE